MANPSEVFAALPHVDEIWITDDGHFHLHPHNGGERFERGQVEIPEEKPEETPEETPENESHPRPKRRQKIK